MFYARIVGVCLVIAVLGGCGGGIDSIQAEGPDETGGIDRSASAEDLYFEVLRLHSAGFLPDKRVEALQRSLDDVDAHFGDSPDHGDRIRETIASALRRIRNDLRQGENSAVFEGYEGRAYAQKLNRAGMREAERYADRAVFIAGMLGVPTSKQDAALMIAVPVGGFIVVKVGGMALKRTAFFLRRLRTADEVVERAKGLGFKAAYAADREELRHLVGDAATEAVEHAHVGAGGGLGGGKRNPWNPARGRENCTACVTSVIRSSLTGYFEHGADEVERIFGYVGRERHFDPHASLLYIEKATGLTRSAKPVAMLGGRAPVGHYAVFTKWADGGYNHVVYGRVTATGRVVIFDPQVMKHMTYEEMMKEYGTKAMPYLLESK